MTHRTVAYGRSLAVLVAFVAALLLAREHVNGASAGSILLLAVVLAGRFSGLGPALATAGMAAALYLFFFLPPVGFSVGDPNDWIAVLSFLVTAAVAGSMLAQTEQAIRQRDHFERLYWTIYGKATGGGEKDPENRQP